MSIGVGESYGPPRPPNRTGGFPAYGSPVGGFLIGVVSLLPSGVKCEPFGIREGGNCPFNAVASADSMRSVHTSASAHTQFRWVGVSAPCLATSALAVLLCPGMVFTHPPSCPAFPRTGFASPSFRGPCTRPQRYYAGSDSCCASPTQQVSPLRSLAFPASRPQPRYAARSSRAYHLVPPVSPRGPDFALHEQARHCTPPNRVRYPTGCRFASSCSPPRLAATQLPSATCAVISHGTDSHYADIATSRTHSCPALCRASTP